MTFGDSVVFWLGRLLVELLPGLLFLAVLAAMILATRRR